MLKSLKSKKDSDTVRAIRIARSAIKDSRIRFERIKKELDSRESRVSEKENTLKKEQENLKKQKEKMKEDLSNLRKVEHGEKRIEQITQHIKALFPSVPDLCCFS